MNFKVVFVPKPPDIFPGSARSVPLAVDLDGTLVRTDTLVETVFLLVKTRFYLVFAVPFWLLRGKAYFKQRVAENTELNVALLPFHDEFLSYLKLEKQNGRELILVTAADKRIAEAVAAHSGLFSSVLASDGSINLSGRKKATSLVELYGTKGFDYAGNADVDLAIWKEARQAIVVNGTRGLAEKAGRFTTVGRVFERNIRLGQLIKVLRMHQWVKNILVFVPAGLAHVLTSRPAIESLVLAFFAFSFCASSVYILNDLFDLESDRQHPKKRDRAFASGTVPVLAGICLAPFFLLAGFAMAAAVSWSFVASVAVYFGLTSLYSFRLKQIMIVDVILLAFLYTLRLLAGAVASGVILSAWLLAFSMFLFLSLAYIKRVAELQTFKQDGRQTPPGRGYVTQDLPQLASLGAASGYIATLVLALYLNSDAVRQLYRVPEALWLICPIILYWISRAWMITHRGQMDHDPIVFALQDRVSYILGALVAVILSLATSGFAR